MKTKRVISNPFCKEFQKSSLQILQPPQPEEGVLWISGKNIIRIPVWKTYGIRIPLIIPTEIPGEKAKKFAFPSEFQVDLMLYAFPIGKVEEFPWNTLKADGIRILFYFFRSSPRISPSISPRPFSRFTVRKTVPDIIIGQAHDIFSRILQVRICKFFYQILCHIFFLKGSKLKIRKLWLIHCIN